MSRMTNVCSHRLHAYELVVRGLRQHKHNGDKMVDDALAELNRIDARVERIK
jgi:hypothetical protein